MNGSLVPLLICLFSNFDISKTFIVICYSDPFYGPYYLLHHVWSQVTSFCHYYHCRWDIHPIPMYSLWYIYHLLTIRQLWWRPSVRLSPFFLQGSLLFLIPHSLLMTHLKSDHYLKHFPSLCELNFGAVVFICNPFDHLFTSLVRIWPDSTLFACRDEKKGKTSWNLFFSVTKYISSSFEML